MLREIVLLLLMFPLYAFGTSGTLPAQQQSKSDRRPSLCGLSEADAFACISVVESW